MNTQNKIKREKEYKDLKRYNVTLSEGLVDKALEKNIGIKLSPILNELLRLWFNNPKLIYEEEDRQNEQKTSKET